VLAPPAGDPILGLLPDPGDLGLRPVLDPGHFLFRMPPEGVRVGGGPSLDLLDLRGPFDPELLQGGCAGLLGGRLHRMGQVDEELRGSPGGRRRGDRDLGDGHRLGNGRRRRIGRLVRRSRLLGLAGRWLDGLGVLRRKDGRLRIHGLRLAREGLVCLVEGWCPIRTPREPEARSRFGGGHVARSSCSRLVGASPLTQCGC
jgi:hypothetical protein